MSELFSNKDTLMNLLNKLFNYRHSQYFDVFTTSDKVSQLSINLCL